MKGNPLLRLSLVLLLLAAVLVPVCILTTPPRKPSLTPATPQHGPSKPATMKPLPGRLLLHAAPSPLRCSVTLQGKPLLTERNLLAPGEYGADVRIPPDADLLVTAEWTDGTPHAVLVEFFPEGTGTLTTKSYWAKRSLEDTLSVTVSTAP